MQATQVMQLVYTNQINVTRVTIVITKPTQSCRGQACCFVSIFVARK